VVRRRFSAGGFWTDVAEHGCTIFLYIGELCRYLLAAPPDPRERGHRLRLCAGNGLRGQIWESFADRFEIPQILEFYASTEGNVSLYNCEGRPGAIGRVPPFLAHRFPIALIACDPDTGAPTRGADGLCVACPPGAAGEAIGRIGAGHGAGAGAFEGYTDVAATELKVLRNVFEPGDAWFRTGDLMRRDPAGFFYFVDRMGDTFRWKGENVSTTQVADAVSACPGVREAVVYGVAAPGAEGRAGMAAICAGADLNLADLHARLGAALPDYARPVFLRLCDEIDATGTFKPIKARLVREGCDPRLVSDPLFFNDRRSGRFAPLDPATYEQLEQAAIRL
jgi:fatty-acyl-CoA synthase